MGYPQSTVYTVMLKVFKSSDHVSPNTGLGNSAVAIQISKAGGTFGNPSAGASYATEVANGWYSFSLTTTDTNTLGDLVVRGTNASSDDSERWLPIVKATNGGMTALPDAAFNTGGGLAARVPPNGAGTATAGSANTITLQTALGANNLVNGNLITILSGTGAGQTMVISGYVDSTKVVTISQNWVTNPDNTSVYVITNDDLPVTDSSQRVLLQATQTGVTIPTVTNVTQLGGQNVVLDSNNIICVDVKYINGVATTPVTTVAAVQGTSQALTFDANNLPKVDVEDIRGTPYSGTAGYFLDWSKIQNPTSTVDFTNTTIKGIDGVTFPTHFNAMLISAAGNVGIDWSNVSNPTSTVALNGTTIGTATNTSNIPNVTLASSQPNYTPATHTDATTIEAAIAALGSPMQSGSYVSPPSAATIAATTAAVLFVDGATNQLKVNTDHSINATVSGTIVNYVNVGSVTAAAAQQAGTIACLIGDTLAYGFTIGTITGWTKIVVTAKRQITDPDSSAIFQVVVNSSGGGGGLVILNGAVPSDPTQGSLSVSDATAGTIALTVSATETATIAAGQYFYSLRAIGSFGAKTPIVNCPFIATLTTNNLYS